MRKLYFATSNKGKVGEAAKILEFPIEIANIEIDEIQSLDIRKVAEAKAREAYKKVKNPVFIDDVSFEVEAWNGFPGPFIKFIMIAGNNNYDLLVRMLSAEKNRKVKVTAVIGYHDGKKVHVIEGSFTGKIVPKRGNKGWGFDPYVIPDGFRKTLGEMGEGFKNKVSHRARALQNFERLLNSQKA